MKTIYLCPYCPVCSDEQCKKRAAGGVVRECYDPHLCSADDAVRCGGEGAMPKGRVIGGGS